MLPAPVLGGGKTGIPFSRPETGLRATDSYSLLLTRDSINQVVRAPVTPVLGQLPLPSNSSTTV